MVPQLLVNTSKNYVSLFRLCVVHVRCAKSTLVKQAIASFDGVGHCASAELPSNSDAGWVQQQWDIARRVSQSQSYVLGLDEVRKIQRWSEVTKIVGAEDGFLVASPHPLRVVLLGVSLKFCLN